VRDIFIAGLGDSIASGEGNPDRPVALADEGFCFRYYMGSAAAQYYRPSRGGYKGGRACEAPDSLQNWQHNAAVMVQLAVPPLALQLSDPHRAGARRAISAHRRHLSAARLHRAPPSPTACSAAQRVRECPPSKSNANLFGGLSTASSTNCATPSPPARRRMPDRQLDLVLLSIGANDIYFSGLVADVIVDTKTERALFRRTGVISSVDDSRHRSWCATCRRDLANCAKP